MKNISFYKPDGYIFGLLTGDESVITATIENTHDLWIDGAWDSKTHYVSNGQAVARPANTATLDGLTLLNLPVPCKIVINSTVYDCTEPTADLEFDYPGVYNVTVEAFPYLNAEFEIET
jgi:hypothetical protein